MILPALKPRSQLVPCRTIIYGLKIAGPWKPSVPSQFLPNPASSPDRGPQIIFLIAAKRRHQDSSIHPIYDFWRVSCVMYDFGLGTTTWNMVRGGMETMIYIPNSITRCFNAQVHTSWLQRGRQVKLFGDSTVLCLTIFVKVSGISFGPYDFQICP